MVKIVRYGVALLNDSVNTFEGVVEALQDVLNWDVTQCLNSANIVHSKGEYLLKWFDSEEVAYIVASQLRMRGLKVKMIIDKSGTIEQR